MSWNISCCSQNSINSSFCIEQAAIEHVNKTVITELCLSYTLYRSFVHTTVLHTTRAFLAVGLILHLACIVVFTKGTMRTIPSITFFIVLSIWNIVTLCMNQLSYMVRSDLRDWYASEAFCAMFGLLFIYPRQMSSCTMAMISVEYLTIMKYPFHRAYIDKYRKFLLVIPMGLLLLPIPFDAVYTRKTTSKWSHCYVNEHFIGVGAYQVIRAIFNVTFYAILPLVTIIYCNIGILRTLSLKSLASLRSSMDGAETSLNQRIRMQTLLSACFFVLLMPFYIHWFVTYLLRFPSYCKRSVSLYEDVHMCMGTQYPTMTAVERILRDSNHVFHFLFYTVTSKSFRSDTKRLFWILPSQFLRECAGFSNTVGSSTKSTIGARQHDFHDDDDDDDNVKDQRRPAGFQRR